MKTLLGLDFVIQALVIVLGLVWICLDDVSGISIYFVAGGIQVLSMLLHLPRILTGKWVLPVRVTFYRFNAAILLVGLVFLLAFWYGKYSPALMMLWFYLFAMLFIGVLNTAWYFYITWREYLHFKQEEEQRNLLDLTA